MLLEYCLVKEVAKEKKLLPVSFTFQSLQPSMQRCSDSTEQCGGMVRHLSSICGDHDRKMLYKRRLIKVGESPEANNSVLFQRDLFNMLHMQVQLPKSLDDLILCPGC